MGKIMTSEFTLVGETLALDFTNTMDGWRGAMREKLLHYDDLLAWAVQTNSISEEWAETLRQKAAARPKDAANALARAIDVREALFRIFSALSDGSQPKEKNIATFNAELARALTHSRLALHGDHFDWAWKETDDLGAVTWAALQDAANLLTSSERLEYVRQCGGDNCDWLFLDTTKNHSRRWCDMKTCGNVHKVRKHRQAQRE
jgi:predicted RNA-binding Zn ribbon-like protein